MEANGDDEREISPIVVVEFCFGDMSGRSDPSSRGE
jgi:hypothetical protein